MSGGMKMTDFRRIEKKDLQGILALCKAEGWPSLVKDPGRAWRVLTAPGVISLVAVDSGQVIGFVQMQSDGAIQAHLALILVAPHRRDRGIGTRLIEEAFRLSGAERIDLITEQAPHFYRSFAHYEWPGFRIYPQYNKDGSPKKAFERD
jgi:ribosomal protein S18 acetylase RimI-like enzyme